MIVDWGMPPKFDMYTEDELVVDHSDGHQMSDLNSINEDLLIADPIATNQTHIVPPIFSTIKEQQIARIVDDLPKFANPTIINFGF